MRIIDPACVRRFREAVRCEHCKRYTGGCDPAHVFAKGMGAGSRLDIAINLVALCRLCHSANHNGRKPTRADLLGLVAKREGGGTPEAVETEIRRLLRLTKEGREPR